FNNGESKKTNQTTGNSNRKQKNSELSETRFAIRRCSYSRGKL
ncbi:hypothetical protein Tco_1149814, partial [Tanacetum coccineum]